MSDEIQRSEPAHQMSVTKKEASMLLEMTTQTAAKGPDAAVLASLHAMALEAVEAHAGDIIGLLK
jgi:hypothetical protein